MGRVSGKVAIVTGSAHSNGLGAAMARRLVEEGAKVVLADVLDKEGEAMAKSLGGNACFMHLDVTSEVEWKKIVSVTEAAFGPVTVLVNNAGIIDYIPFEQLEEAQFRRVIDVNQVGVFLGMKTVLPSMKRAGSGSIINISSVGGLLGFPSVVGYIASKHAVSGMTKAGAIEFAPHNVRVNSVHPGIVATNLGSDPNIREFALSQPAGRIGEPDEVANVVLMLASDESRFSTGAQFVVDGGMSCH